MRMPSTDRRISSSSEVNIPTAMRGRNSPMTNPAVVTHVAPMIVSFSTRITRSYCFAPKLYPAIGCMPWLTPSTIITKKKASRLTMP